jgi:hypothetical protein
VSSSRRYQVRLPAPMASALGDFAREHGLAVSAAIRLLIGNGLSDDAALADARGESPPESPAALAALTASEHAVLMVASVLPEGEELRRSLADRAVEAAEERLALFRQPEADPEVRP